MKRKKFMRSKFICMILLVSILIPTVPVHAKKSKNYWPRLSEEITAGAAILMDVDTGTILYKKNINTPYYPASITKILTTLIAVENSRMDEKVTFSRDAVYKTEGSGIWRDVGEVMTMEQCLYAVMLESANECAYAVAEHISGSMSKFVKLMNERAKSIGCTSSKFMNPHGLPDEKHVVTAKDMALIARAAYENETFRSICGTKRYTIPPTNKHSESTYMVNHHKMLYPKDTDAYLYDYCMGGKTGYTNAAGNTLVTYAQKDGMTLLAVILNGSSPQYWNETRALFDFGFENFNLCNVSEYFEADESYDEEKYDTLNTNDPYAQIDPQARIILPKTVNFNKAVMKINYENLPDDVLAQLKYTYGKRSIGTADVIRTRTLTTQNDIIKDVAANNQNQTDTNSETDDSAQTEDLKKPEANDEELKNQSDQKSEPKDEKVSFIDKVKNMDLVDKIKNINIGNIFADIKNWFHNFKFDFSLKSIIICGCIAAVLILAIVFRIYYEKSYMIRQKIANYRNRKRAQKQYIIIRDTRRSRRGRRKRR